MLRLTTSLGGASGALVAGEDVGLKSPATEQPNNTMAPITNAMENLTSFNVNGLGQFSVSNTK
jgi:hypothetical protein